MDQRRFQKKWQQRNRAAPAAPSQEGAKKFTGRKVSEEGRRGRQREVGADKPRQNVSVQTTTDKHNHKGRCAVQLAQPDITTKAEDGKVRIGHANSVKSESNSCTESSVRLPCTNEE